MTTSRKEVAWIFQFGLESAGEDFLDESIAEALMNHLIEWAEARGLQIGGGYHGDSDHERYLGMAKTR